MKPPFRRNLLSATIEFVCRYWRYPATVEDYRIGEAVRNAQATAEALK
jgi:hypothetical protein